MTCPLFIEYPCGFAALSIALQRGFEGRGKVKPISPLVGRSGSKAGYAVEILEIMGLKPGQGADCYLWVDDDPLLVAALSVMVEPVLALELAEYLIGWQELDRKALWEVLKPDYPWSDYPLIERVAAYLYCQARMVGGRPLKAGMQFAPEYFWWEAEQKWSGNGTPLTTLIARLIDQAEHPIPAVVERFTDPFPVPKHTIVYIDPPYQGTLGYPGAKGMTRAEVVDLACSWRDRGAQVYVSEAEPLLEIPRSGSHNLTRRASTKRHASKQQDEWLTWLINDNYHK